MIDSSITKKYFNKISKKTGHFQDLFIVLVTHIVQDREYLIKALTNVAEVGMIIPKPKSIQKNELRELEKNYFFYKNYCKKKCKKDCLDHIIDRDYLDNNPTKVIDTIEEKANGKDIIILDIGGYFVNIHNEIKDHFKERFIGIIEDTENGHQKYEKKIESSKTKIYSVARSPLKIPEDYLVGLSICFSAEAVMREENEILTGKIILVIGYGKIGSSIARHLSGKNNIVYIHDTDYLKLVEASSHGFPILTKDSSLRKADVVFCATGNNALETKDAKYFKENAMIFTSTSSDDELNFSANLSEYRFMKPVGKSGHLVCYSFEESKSFILCNKGEAVNFLHGASVGNYIYLVQSEIVYGIKVLMENSHDFIENTINEIDINDQRDIAQIWVESFLNTD